MLVGDGPERTALEALAQREGANVYFMGQRSKEEVVKQLHRSHLFVSSSVQLGEQTEGTPTVVMEAMAAGLPVIVTDVGGAKSLVKDGENGFVIPQADQSALIEAIRRLVDNPGLLDEQSRRNVKDSIQFDWRVIGSRVEKVYGSVSPFERAFPGAD
jgi:glycosyltransferase involved in cell wall biosynthesis